MQEYNDLCIELSTVITKRYSTSFTRGIKSLGPEYRSGIYAIYGFVRLADEIVDTFHEYDKKGLLDNFRKETYAALESRISTNPVIHAFQLTVHKYRIEKELIDAFLFSMELDLEKKSYDQDFYNKYIYGSAEVVGLMCLHVFCDGDPMKYSELKEPAKRLGAAFQKVNFLRDLKADYQERGRVYFPGVDFSKFDDNAKRIIEADIDADFKAAYAGMMALPKGVRPGVYTAFIYYRELLKKIQAVPASKIMAARIRVPDHEKILLLLRTYSKFGFN
jgi:15-cis-phytoene synthase